MSPFKSKLFFYFTISLVFLLTGCDREEEAIPSYMEILPFELTTDYLQEGSASHKIIDAWVYVGTDFLGAYELPITIPVLASGTNELTIFPGIKSNGIASNPVINDFYNRFESTITLQEGEITTVQPTTTYREDAKFPYIENFDAAHTIEDDEDGNSNTMITLVSDGAFENSSGFIRVDSANIQLEAATNIRIENLPTNGASVFLEMDYKNDIQFAVGLIGHQTNIGETKQYIIILNTKEEWNKIYIDLTSELAITGLSEYQLVFNTILPVDENNLIEGSVYLDNIKIVHF